MPRWLAFAGMIFPFAFALFAWVQQPGEPQKEAPPQFVSAFALEIEPGHEQAFIERFQKRAKIIDQAKGFKGMFVLQHAKDTNRFVVLTLWQDEKSFRDWVNSEGFRKAHAESGIPAKAVRLDTYRVVVR